MDDTKGALVPVGTTELVKQDEQWLKPWQYLVGFLSPLWLIWTGAEIDQFIRGKAPIDEQRHGRRMTLLQLLMVLAGAVVFGPKVTTYILGTLMFLQVFILPAPNPTVKALPEGDGE